MSRLDYITIAIVVICLAALIFVIYKTTNILGNNSKENTEQTESAGALEDESYFPEGDTYSYDDEGDITDGSLYDEEEGGVDEFDSGFDSDEDASDEDFFDKGTSEITDEGSFSGGDSGEYLVLAGTFSIMSNAEKEVARLKSLGFENAEVGMFNRQTYASVLVSRFEDAASARSLVRRLESEYDIDAYVHQKR